MMTEQKYDIIKQYQREELNSVYEQNIESGNNLFSRLMVFTMANSYRKKLVYLSSHKFPKTDIGLLFDAINSNPVDKIVPSWSGVLEYFTCIPISKTEKDHLIQESDKQGISIRIRDYTTIVEHPMLKKLIDDTNDFEYNDLTPIQRGIYEIIAYGSVSTNIKKRLTESYVLHTLSADNNAGVSHDNLLNTISKKGIAKEDIARAISSLQKKQLIKPKETHKDILVLTDKGRENVMEARAKSIEEEACFTNELQYLFEKYGIKQELKNDVLTSLKRLAINTYTCILNHQEPSSDFLDSFSKYLTSMVHSDVTEFLQDMISLCRKNSFIARISIGEIYVNKVNSNEIETYTKNVKKCIYLDTPVIVYWLCHLAYKIPKDIDWDNFRYQATRDLFDLIAKYPQEIELRIRQSYLKEVAGELQKALRLQILEKANFPIEFRTNNTFYQYYTFVKERRDIGTFSDFLKDLSLKYQDVDNIHFIDKTATHLSNIISSIMSDEIIDREKVYDEHFEAIKMSLPSKYLESRNPRPLDNDVNQVLRIKQLSKGLNLDLGTHFFVATWDSIFNEIRRVINTYFDSGLVFYISSPTQLASQLAMARFSLSADILSDAMFITADTTDAIKDLYDNALSLLVDSDNASSLHILQKLLEAQKSYLETTSISQEQIDEQGYPLENVIDGICSQVMDWDLSMTILKKYINDESQFEQIRADLEAGYAEIRLQKDFLNGEAIKRFKEHLTQWSDAHPEADSLDDDLELEEQNGI